MKKIIIILLSLVTLISAQDLSGKKLYINAGHGGHDSGDRPPINDAGYFEAEGNLTRALVVETILKKWGATVVMSRRHNRSSDGVALSSLGSDATNQNCDWFHSIHTNAAGGNSTLMLYSGFTGDPRINNGLTTSPSSNKFPGMLTLSDFMGNNLVAALQTTFYKHAGDYTFYGSGDNYLGVFRYLNIPGTLSESSFHDYWPNTYRLQNLDNRINDAWAIALAFAQYYGEPKPQFANLAGIVRTKELKTNYEYIDGTDDEYQPIDSIVVTVNPGNRIYYGNRTMYIDSYTPQWSQITTGSPIDPNNWAAVDNRYTTLGSSYNYDYYMNGYNNNHGYNRNNGFYLFDSLAYGTYEVIYNAPGYWPDTLEVTVSSAKFFWTQNIFMDSSVPPFVRSFSPANNEPVHPAWEPIVLSFSHEMDTTAVRNGFSIAPAADLIFNWNSTNKVLTLNAVGDSLEVETSYTLTLEADSIFGNRHQNLDGNGDGIGGDDFVLEFTTSPPDIYPPLVADYFPPRAAKYDDLQPIISYFFDEIVDSTGGLEDKFELIRTSGTDITIPTVFDMYVINGKTIISLFTTEELERGKRYARWSYSGLSDLFNNVTESDQVSSLLIDSDTPWYADTLIIDGFGSNSRDIWWKPSASGSTVNVLEADRYANNTVVNHGSGSAYSMKLYYKFDSSKSDCFLREYMDAGSAPAQRKFNSNGILQTWVFGDGTGNLFRFAVDDPSGTGTSEVSPWYPLDFTGWKLIKWDLRDGECGTWPSVSDGTLNGQLNFDSFQIEYVDSLGNNEGTLYFEDLWFLTPGGVAVTETDIPVDFTMNQNYPNPFNPTTAISYQLPTDNHVNLSVFDIHGRRVATLINEAQSAGTYSVNFNAGPLPSGVYIASLKTNMGVLNQKMLLVK
ncbi:MAG: N-acetylmuramoyl-L-alanine amidase [Candidatus Marinimicrobia bacterium]|nr:N-acetylmuramoyl-L-alanine amidase [Candidatus Neomarinimicrobiota bacterium]